MSLARTLLKGAFKDRQNIEREIDAYFLIKEVRSSAAETMLARILGAQGLLDDFENFLTLTGLEETNR